MTVLVVEDEPRIATFLARLLGASGFAVEYVSTGGDALARLAVPAGVDVVLLDLSLPDIDGLDVLAALRDAGATPSVVVLTARVDPHDRAEALALGAVAYLTKPVRRGELVAQVRAAAGDAR